MRIRRPRRSFLPICLSQHLLGYFVDGEQQLRLSVHDFYAQNPLVIGTHYFPILWQPCAHLINYCHCCSPLQSYYQYQLTLSDLIQPHSIAQATSYQYFIWHLAMSQSNFKLLALSICLDLRLCLYFLTQQQIIDLNDLIPLYYQLSLNHHSSVYPDFNCCYCTIDHLLVLLQTLFLSQVPISQQNSRQYFVRTYATTILACANATIMSQCSCSDSMLTQSVSSYSLRDYS